jgi:hypothetical protein
LPPFLSLRSGNPLDRQSLHYIDPSGQAMNQYQGAISMVGEVLQFYDTDKRYPVYGFGGQFRTRKHTQPHTMSMLRKSPLICFIMEKEGHR